MTATVAITQIQPVLGARDVSTSVAFYQQLGFQLAYQDDVLPKYAVVQRDGQELHLQWADPSQWAYPIDRPVCRLAVKDVDALYAEFLARGVIDEQTTHGRPWASPGDTPWGTREFHLRDPGDNGLHFYCAR